jgi:NAD(P)-dependent dehydrogenase (short-subunit alcohol dehydrogenase family)
MLRCIAIGNAAAELKIRKYREEESGGSISATSTTEEVLSAVNLHGKPILVTRVSAGLAWTLRRLLLRHGSQIVGAVRNLTNFKVAPGQMLKEAASHAGSFGLVLDLADLMRLRHCTDALLAKGEPFDMVIASAGVMGHAVFPYGGRL